MIKNSCLVGVVVLVTLGFTTLFAADDKAAVLPAGRQLVSIELRSSLPEESADVLVRLWHKGSAVYDNVDAHTDIVLKLEMVRRDQIESYKKLMHYALRGKFGRALHCAIALQELALAKVILIAVGNRDDVRAAVQRVLPSGKTLLHHVVCLQGPDVLDVVRLFIRSGADVWAAAEKTPYLYASDTAVEEELFGAMIRQLDVRERY